MIIITYIKKKKEFNNYKFKILKIVEAVNCINFIHIGSSRQYKRKDIPQSEKVKTKPDTNYGKYKQFEHLSFKRILKNKNLKYYNLRVFSIYGMYLKKKILLVKC